MKIENVKMKSNLLSITEFSKLPTAAQKNELNARGIFVDQYSEKGSCVTLWFLNGFFVEEKSDRETGITDITAYRQGYRVKDYFEPKEVLALKIAS